MSTPTRPALRYLGGKWRIAPWIVEHFPPHRVYVEPFGGAASVLLRKPRSYAEIYNDLDQDVVNLFRILRDPEAAAKLVQLVALTPYARDEFFASYEPTDDPIEAARRLLVRSFMGHGSTAVGKRTRTGFRADSNRSGSTPTADWAGYPPALAAIVDRLKGVVIESRPALDIIDRFDDEGTLIYADPPYLHATRSQKRNRGQLECSYEHEMTDADHEALLARLVEAKASVIISGYPAKLYDRALKGWERVEREALADGARPRIEVLWINPVAVERRRRASADQTIDMFESAAA